MRFPLLVEKYFHILIIIIGSHFHALRMTAALIIKTDFQNANAMFEFLPFNSNNIGLLSMRKGSLIKESFNSSPIIHNKLFKYITPS